MFLKLACTIVCLGALGGCGRDTPSRRVGAAEEARAVRVEKVTPRLLRETALHERGFDSVFWRSDHRIAVSSKGVVGVLGSIDSARRFQLTLVDPSAGGLQFTGRTGAGPGELSNTWVIMSSDDGFDVYDMQLGAVVRYSDDGRLRGEFRLPRTDGYVLAVAGDSADVMSMRWDSQADSAPLVTRYPLHGGTGRVLLWTTDSFVNRVMSKSGRSGTAGLVLPYARTEGAIVVVDPLEYVIHVYDETGRLKHQIRRDVEPRRRDGESLKRLQQEMREAIREAGGRAGRGWQTAARLDTLEREVLPQVLWPGIGFDRKGRLVVIGMVGDSTFVDFFSDSRFLGRRVLACRDPGRRVGVNGDWLTALCERPESIASPFQLQLYHLVEGRDSI